MEIEKASSLLSIEARKRLVADRDDLRAAIQRGEYEEGADKLLQTIEAQLNGEPTQAPMPTSKNRTF